MIELATEDPDALVAEIDLAATPGEVYRALTDPDLLVRWWGATTVYWCTEWSSERRPGGSWRSAGLNRAGQPFVVEGELLELVPHRRVAFSWRPSWEAELPATRIEIDLAPGGGESSSVGGESTRLCWSHRGFAGFPDARERHRQGMPLVLGWLREYVEEGRVAADRA